jgi:hypothetical protein
MSLILHHKVPLSIPLAPEHRIFTHNRKYAATNSGTKILYNLASSINSCGPMSAIDSPNCKGLSADLRDWMSLIAR